MSSQPPRKPKPGNPSDVFDNSLADTHPEMPTGGCADAQGRPSPTLELVGSRFGKYAIRDLIGMGSFGVVYRAIDTVIGREVALKLARPGAPPDPAAQQRFEAEAEAAGTLAHPGIATLYDADPTGPQPYLASAYVEGPDLGRWLAEQTEPPPVPDAVALLLQLAESVAFAHSKSVLHRDLKPGNVLLEPLPGRVAAAGLASFRPRLTDFGLAKLFEFDQPGASSSLLVGTPVYMPPERLESGEDSFAADVYSLGVILFELLTLRPPFAGGTYVEVLDRARNSEPTPPRKLRPDVPVDLEAICLKCLSKDPEERYPTAHALVKDLQRFSQGEPTVARPATAWNRLHRWRQRPARIELAGRYTAIWQGLITFWIFSTFLAASLLGAISDEVIWQNLRDGVFVSALFHCPLGWLGWCVRRKRAWAFWPAAAGSVVLLAVLIYSAFGDSVAFAHNYPTPISKVSVFSGLIQGTLVQCLLFVLAIPAWRRLPGKATSAGV